MSQSENTLTQAVEEFACEVMAIAMFSNLSWQDAVAGLGLASKLLATQAAHSGIGRVPDACIESQTAKLLAVGLGGAVEVGPPADLVH